MKKIFLFFNFITIFNFFYAMELVDLEKVKSLPHDLQKVVLIETKEMKNFIYDSMQDRFITFQLNVKSQKQPFLNPWKFSPVKDDAQLKSMEKQNLNIVYFQENENEKQMPIVSTDLTWAFIAGPNKENLVAINNKAFFFNDIKKNSEESALKLFCEHGAHDHTELSFKDPFLIHPEKNLLIGSIHKDKKKKYYLCKYEDEKWQEQDLPLFKKPIAFGPKNLLVCKKLVENWTLQYPKGETNICELYDINAQKVTETIDFSTLITQKKIIPQNLLKKTINCLQYAQKVHESFEEEFYKNAQYEVAQIGVDYFPNLENYLLFSFSLHYRKENIINKPTKPFHFVLYDVEKKLFHYVGSSLTKLTFLISKQKRANLQQAQFLNKEFGTIGMRDESTPKDLENNLIEINIYHQLVSLVLIENTWNWLQQDKPDLKVGEKLLDDLHNFKTKKERSKLRWQTTTEEHGNIFKKLVQKVKELRKQANT